MTLTILYDADCKVCRRLARWLEAQPAFMRLELLACGSPEALDRFGELRPWLCRELVVVNDRGEVWIGAAAFLVCLWSLRTWRGWSDALSHPWLLPATEAFFKRLSAGRRWLAPWQGSHACEGRHCGLPAKTHPYR